MQQGQQGVRSADVAARAAYPQYSDRRRRGDPAGPKGGGLKRAITPRSAAVLHRRRHPRRGDLRPGRAGRRRDRWRDLGRLRAGARGWRRSPPVRTPSSSANTRARAAPELYVHRAFGHPFLQLHRRLRRPSASGIASASALARGVRRRLPERVRRRAPSSLTALGARRADRACQPARHRGVREAQRRLHARRDGRACC